MVLFEDPQSTSGVRTLATLSLQPANGTSFHDVAAGVLAVAAPPLAQEGPLPSVAVLYLVSLPGGDVTSLASVPSTLDVKNNLIVDKQLSWSYDASGMYVTQVHRAPCRYNVPGDCYVVYMQRADLHRLKVYVPVPSGGGARPPVYYDVDTDVMRNAVPPTLTRTGAFATYTLVRPLFGPAIAP